MTLDEKIRHAKMLLDALNGRYREIMAKLLDVGGGKEVVQELDDFISMLAKALENK